MISVLSFYVEISIHALREEGDNPHNADRILRRHISIHALREEGDALHHNVVFRHCISIHALREEGDNDGHL